MARIVIVGPSQPSRTPRLVRNAAALSKGGHSVVVVTPVIESAFIGFDEKLVAEENWKYIPVSMLNERAELKKSVRAIRKAAFSIASAIPLPANGSDALIYGARKIRNTIFALDADLYLAQQQASLPLVAQVAIAKGKPYACDIEDILTESSTEPVRLLSSIEQRYLQGAAVVSTMSEVAADYLDKNLKQNKKVIALHNCPDIRERDGLNEPAARDGIRPSIYWFGQTLGPHSLAIELIEANAAIGHPFNIALRGKANQNYLEKVVETIKATYSENRVEILPIVDTTKMVSEAAKYDILFGSQPSEQLFHQLAIGNKVFTGLLAGCALLVTDTIAHRKLMADLADCMLLVGNGKNELANALKTLTSDSEGLLRMRKSAWDSGTTRYHWARESRDWVSAINNALKGRE